MSFGPQTLSFRYCSFDIHYYKFCRKCLSLFNLLSKVIAMGNFISFFKQVAGDLQAEGRFGTAHVYQSTLNTVTSFHGSSYLGFRRITPEWLKKFEVNLRERGCSWNTVSTYIRVIRAVYNRAVEIRKTEYVPYLFRSVYTGTRADRKRALDDKDIQKVFGRVSRVTTTSTDLKRTQELFILMFLLRGLPFVDLAYLRKNDLCGNVITYRRRKTGRSLSVTLTPEAILLMDKCVDRASDSPYLFPILKSAEGTQEAYHEYQLALRTFNFQLELLGRLLGTSDRLSSYTARHTWATTAYYCEVHPGIISEAMGHSSITVTETYLKPFHDKKIDEANLRILNYLKQSVFELIV